MKERLLHILDGTACLTRRQMKDYLAGTMLPEEIHAAEAHIASCPLCNMALEGFEEHNEEALAAIASLNSGFLKEHFDAITPQIHLNSLSPAAVVNKTKKKSKSVSLGRLMAVAAIALLAVGTFWYVKYAQQDQPQKGMIAQRDETQLPVPAATPPAGVRIADSTMAQPTPPSRTNTAALDEPSPIIKEAKIPAVSEPAAPAIASAKKSADTDGIAYSDDGPGRNAGEPNGEQRIAVMETGGGRAVSAKMAKPLVDPKPPSLAKVAEEKAKQERASSEAARGELAANSNDRNTMVADRAQRVADDRTDQLQKGDEYFSSGKYSAALRSYRSAMASDNRSRSGQASLMAARCYINLGQKAKGIDLLQRIVTEGSGSQRRQAKRLLRDLERD